MGFSISKTPCVHSVHVLMLCNYGIDINATLVSVVVHLKGDLQVSSFLIDVILILNCESIFLA